MNEVLSCIKLIKMYAWERSFAKVIGGKVHQTKNLPLSQFPAFSGGKHDLNTLLQRFVVRRRLPLVIHPFYKV